MNNLGVMYSEGKGGLPKDAGKAVDWFRKAAELGDADAMNNLGTMYEDGKGGLPKNSSEALNCYQKAASSGSATAEHNVKRLLTPPAASTRNSPVANATDSRGR